MAKATPAPWEVLNSKSLNTVAVSYAAISAVPFAIIQRDRFEDSRVDNAKFIAHSRTDLERLVKMVELARDALDTVKAAMSMASSFGSGKVMYECAHSALAELDSLSNSYLEAKP
ncbi:MAG TPA: hypothetical protein VMR37_03425 [Rhabdochlamydiaceae bacterium]|nr:hypothetical protein [Rhabdochlamydiaceae bacterium]